MTKANGDLQAVILVGPGDRLYPLVDEATVNVNVSASAICSSTGNINIINTTGTGGVCSSSGTIPSSTINSSTSMTGSSSNPNLNLNQANVNNFSSTSTSNYSKAMLPLCNRPLIYYPLTWLTQNGIGEVFIVVHQKFHSKISNYVNRQYEHAEGTKIEVVPVAENEGSLAALLSVRHRLKGDFMVLSCDLVTDAPLSKMADLHRSKGALITCLLSGPQASGLLISPITATASTSTSTSDSSSLTDPRYLASLAGEELLVALDMSTMTSSSDSTHSISSCDLIYCAPQADSLDESNTHLPIKMSTLFRYPKIRLRTDLLDPHCYLFSLGIFGMIEEIIKSAGGRMNSTCDDTFLGNGSNESINSTSFPGGADSKDLVVPASLFSLREDLIPKVLKRVHRFHNSEEITRKPCSTFAVIVDSGNYCLRANTLPALLESMRQLMKSSSSSSSSALGVKVATSAEISPRSQVGNDSLFGESSRLGERSSVKKSVVGNNCSLGSNVKVVNCIVMDGVVIEDGCKLDGCIVGPKALIREKCQLKDCDVAGGFELQKEHTGKGETFGSNRELVEDLY